ncbi:DUF2635 domain-containing protein [Aquitalea sp. ASV15]|uniref:DUF2635 domain-containing protein n=1 Tax=Aquitalea sp. ASV15 TaxID=2795104 RepID=UPI001E2DDD55|nr:DUF2635 domain-containing protein [Aquitalea sp. ASV15]
MKVIAAPGLQVPMENQPRRYINDSESVTVEPTAYYLRQLADGDLLDADAEQADSQDLTALEHLPDDSAEQAAVGAKKTASSKKGTA